MSPLPGELFYLINTSPPSSEPWLHSHGNKPLQAHPSAPGRQGSPSHPRLWVSGCCLSADPIDSAPSSPRCPFPELESRGRKKKKKKKKETEYKRDKGESWKGTEG